MGDSEVDVDNLVLKEEQMPNSVIHNHVDKSTFLKLEKGAVLRVICVGFEEPTEPAACLNGDVETNECLDNSGGCWQDIGANITACKVWMIHSVGGYVNAPWLMVCSSNEMATATVKWYHSGLLIAPFPGLQVGFLITPFSSMH
ncbi:hypothetical protein Pint_02584 [Pistacia integerrima]|uniref:Uncharacterized protein n=1 Tax=Pistacia integerrima TaxID=434235 RepID=A0ACC0ZJT5_9ROSI|nr:hypothetical protein Pint_02584 [Pistacia integerrima]